MFRFVSSRGGSSSSGGGGGGAASCNVNGIRNRMMMIIQKQPHQQQRIYHHHQQQQTRRWLLSSSSSNEMMNTMMMYPKRPPMGSISAEQRAILRKTRKQRAMQLFQEQKQQQHQQTTTTTTSSSSKTMVVDATTATAASTAASTATTTTRSSSSILINSIPSRWFYYMGIIIPTSILVWGIQDENSIPAKISKTIGFTAFMQSFWDTYSKPTHDVLIPDWSQMPNVPHDIPLPPTLVLDLERTLVAPKWDRKYGWRFAKRPGVDQFLKEMAQYYEIILFSSSYEYVGGPIVESLDPYGAIMHRLFRDHTHNVNGVHVKDLARLNRNMKTMIIIDDDPLEVQFQPQNLIRIKPYEDPTNRTDNTLERITPFLLEIAREGYSDIPALLVQFKDMDADDIATEQERRIHAIKQHQEQKAQRGLGRFAGIGSGRSSTQLPEPELPPQQQGQQVTSSGQQQQQQGQQPQQITAKDIADAAAAASSSSAGNKNNDDINTGFIGWMNRRNKEKEEENIRKMEYWNEVMMKKQQQKQQQQQAS